MSSSLPSASSMDLLFHSLGHMLLPGNGSTASSSLAPSAHVLRGLLEMWRAQGIYLPMAPVGPQNLPLVHALSALCDVPPKWLAIFAGDARENALFDSVDGQTVGDRMFARMMASKGRLDSPAMEWWIKNAPEIAADTGAAWIEKLAQHKPAVIYSSYSVKDESVEHFIGLVASRGAKMQEDDPQRPRERWMQGGVWWSTLSAQGRMQDLVRGPSGALRPLDELLALSNAGNHGKYLRWKGDEPRRDENKAPHGRKRDLLDEWVLAPQEAAVGERARRLAMAIGKADGVVEELAVRLYPINPRRRDDRPLLRQVFDYRAPSGMNLMGWFILHKDAPCAWPEQDAEELLDRCVAPDGAGLLLQALRAGLANGEDEFPHWSHGSVRLTPQSTISEPLRRALRGSDEASEVLADLLVDTLVTASPYSLSRGIAKLAASHGLLQENRATQVAQALDVAGLLSSARHAVTQSNQIGSGNPKKQQAYSVRLAGEALAQLKAVQASIESQGCLLSMTRQDWDALFTEAGLLQPAISSLGSAFTSGFAALREKLGIEADALFLSERSTASLSGSSRPRARL